MRRTPGNQPNNRLSGASRVCSTAAPGPKSLRTKRKASCIELAR